MYCPRCNTYNDPSYQFCQSCGLDMRANNWRPSGQLQSPGQHMWTQSLRFVVMLFALWITRSLFTGLSFVRELTIPDFPLTPVMMVNLIIFGFIIFLLVRFAAMLSRYWPAAFPRFAGASAIINAVLYVILLSQIYRSLVPIFQTITRDSEPIMAFQVLLLFVALILVVRALILLYNLLPGWFSNLQVETPPAAPTQPAPVEANPKPVA